MYFDTALTITVTLVSGLFWGALCGAFTNIIYSTIWFWCPEAYLFAICNIATAYITWQFIRFFPRELNLNGKTQETLVSKIMGRVIVLILLSFTLCFAMSILGGLIAALIMAINPSQIGEHWLSVWLSATMFSENTPVFIKEILARIPINIIDRLASVFAGFGIALLIHRFLRKTEVWKKSASPETSGIVS